MNVLDDQISVSGQIVADDLDVLVKAGVEVVVCNRPDNESADQTPFSQIEQAAQAKGLQIVNIPFAGGQMQLAQVEEFASLMATGKRIHAYCRTGNRSSQLWAAAKELPNQ